MNTVWFTATNLGLRNAYIASSSSSGNCSLSAAARTEHFNRALWVIPRTSPIGTIDQQHRSCSSSCKFPTAPTSNGALNSLAATGTTATSKWQIKTSIPAIRSARIQQERQWQRSQPTRRPAPSCSQLYADIAVLCASAAVSILVWCHHHHQSAIAISPAIIGGTDHCPTATTASVAAAL